MFQLIATRRSILLLSMTIGWLPSITFGNDDLSAASALYQQNCADCHGNDGSATEMRGDFKTIPDFQSFEWQSSRTDSKLRASIAMGMGDEMPAFDGDLDGEQIKQLVKLIRTFSPELANSSAAKSKLQSESSDANADSDSFGERMQALENRWAKLVDEFKAARKAAAALKPMNALPGR